MNAKHMQAGRNRLASRMPAAWPALFAAAIAVGFPGAAKAAPDEELTAGQRMLTAVPLPSSDLKLDLWINKANGVYADGESVQIYMRPSEAAYVTIFNTDARGETTVVFPNRFRAQNFVQAGNILQVPGPGADFKLRVSAPYGANLIKALATKKPVSLLDASKFTQTGNFQSFSGGADQLARQIQVTANKEQTAGWASAQLPFTVVAAAGTTTGGPSVNVTPAQPTMSGIPALDKLLRESGGFGLQIVLNQADYMEGDPLSLTAVAEKNCNLTLVNVDERQLGTVLLPNQFEKKRELKAGVTQFLPGGKSKLAYVTAGSGRNALVGFCVAEKPGFWSSLFGKSQAESRSAVAVLGAGDFNAVLAAIDKQPAANVARMAVGYRVAPRR